MEVRDRNIFIASPLFNPEQVAIIEKIEDLCRSNGFGFYSARLHSGSEGLDPRGDRDRWVEVFKSNTDGLDACEVCIAVLDYALPEGKQLRLVDLLDTDEGVACVPCSGPLELPDAGTVWEMGYMSGRRKMVIGFSVNKPADKINLMLCDSVKGIITGFDCLERFLFALSGSISWIDTSQFSYWRGEIE